MADFERYSESQPIMAATPVADKSSATSALAQVFGDVKTSAVEQAVAIRKEQHDMQFLQAQGRLSDVVTSARVGVITNPDLSDAIIQKARGSIDALSQSLREQDKGKFLAYAATHMGTLQLEAARAGRKQSSIQLQNSFAESWKQNLQAGKQEFDPEQFEKWSERSQGYLADMVKSGQMTPAQYESNIKLVHGVMDYHARLTKMAVAGDIDAPTLAKMNALSFDNSYRNNANDPIDSSTGHMYDTQISEANGHASVADADRGVFPNIQTFQSLKPLTQDMVTGRYLGALTAKGHVNAGTHMLLLMAKFQKLNDSPSHSDQEKGELNYYKNFFNQLQHGDFLGVISSTNKGAQIDQDHIQRATAIENSGNSQADKQASLNDESNRVIQERVAYARAIEMPEAYINPIPKEVTDNVKASFSIDGKPDNALKAVYGLSKDSQHWLAKSMNDPSSLNRKQSAAIYGVALRRNGKPDNGAPDSFDYDLIRAGRTVNDYSNLKIGKDADDISTKDTQIRQLIQASMADNLAFMSKLPGGSQDANGVMELGLNYVKQQMQAHNDLFGANKQQYIDEFARNYSKGFNAVKGLNYSFNANEVNLSQADADMVAYYALNTFRADLANKDGKSNAEKAMDVRGYTVTNTRDGFIVIVDNQGNEISSTVNGTRHHLDSQLLTHARQMYKQHTADIEDRIEKEVSINESLRSQNSLSTTNSLKDLVSKGRKRAK